MQLAGLADLVLVCEIPNQLRMTERYKAAATVRMERNRTNKDDDNNNSGD